MSDAKKSFGLIGAHLSHSYSKLLHSYFGYEYSFFELEKSDLKSFLDKRNFLGLNVTIPYKEEILALCDEVDELARQIGSANTLYFNFEKKLHATNTDYFGFLSAMEFANVNLRSETVAILGYGGVSKAIIFACKTLGAKSVYVIRRTLTHTETAEPNVRFIEYKDIDVAKDSTVIINASPVGMFPEVDVAPCDLKFFPKCKFVFDVIYNPDETELLKQARELNIKHDSGLHMLVAQAAKSAEFFTGSPFYKPKTVTDIYQKLKNRLSTPI